MIQKKEEECPYTASHPSVICSLKIVCELRRMEIFQRKGLCVGACAHLECFLLWKMLQLKKITYVLEAYLRFRCAIFLFLFIFFLKGTDT